MQERTKLSFDLIHCKIAYIVACLSSYNILDLSKRINKINKDIDLIKKSMIESKDYIDIRNVIELRNELENLKGNLKEEKEVPLEGHKISCLLFEVSTLIKILINEEKEIKEDMKEYLELSSNILYICGRIINVEILCYEQ